MRFNFKTSDLDLCRLSALILMITLLYLCLNDFVSQSLEKILNFENVSFGNRILVKDDKKIWDKIVDKRDGLVSRF